MSNGKVMVVELSDGSVLTHYREDQDYIDTQPILDFLLDAHHDVTKTSGKTVSGWALCDVDSLDSELAAGRNIDRHISVKKKKSKGAKRVVPRTGTNPGDEDYVVLVSDD